MNDYIKSRLLGMEAMGSFFGYPECCINAFLGRSKAILTTGVVPELTEKQQQFKHGFIPCKECCDKTEVGQEASLIENRICSTTYPEDSYEEEELQNFLTNLNLIQV